MHLRRFEIFIDDVTVIQSKAFLPKVLLRKYGNGAMQAMEGDLEAPGHAERSPKGLGTVRD